MSDLSELQPYIFILLGLIVLLISIFKKSANSDLKATGIKAEGIIYALGYSHNPNSDNSGNIKDKATVRFTTKEKDWITGDIRQGFGIYFTNQYKEGESVDVYYDPANPSNFFVDTKQSENIARILFAIIGLIFCGIGLYQLLL